MKRSCEKSLLSGGGYRIISRSFISIYAVLHSRAMLPPFTRQCYFGQGRGGGFHDAAENTEVGTVIFVGSGSSNKAVSPYKAVYQYTARSKSRGASITLHSQPEMNKAGPPCKTVKISPTSAQSTYNTVGVLQ